MRVVVLGSGGSAGVPQIGGADGVGEWGACDPANPRNRRTRSSIVIQDHGQTLLVDTAPELRQQLLACQIRQVDALLYTHAHADHVAGLDDVRILNRLIGRPLEVFATTQTLADLTRRFDYAFRPWTPPGFFRPVLSQRVVEAGTVENIGKLPVELLDQGHGLIQTLGLRVGPFGYSTDAGTLDEAVINRLRGIDTWLVGCFQRSAHKTHANIAQVVEWAQEIRPRRTILTHMSYDLDWDWMQQHLPPGFEPGFDGMVIELPDGSDLPGSR
jgi:phosphoribosyl 1,2-cyclic phosphate phosphodiesterase